jgi:DHA2 family multidrug resistance protein-like MFS transporter
MMKRKPATSKERSQATQGAEGYPLRWSAMAVLCLVLIVIGMDNLILNVALPTLVRDLQVSASQLQWIVEGYTLAFAGLLLSMGSLGDRFGRKRALTAGLVIFLGGSVASAFAGSAGVLIATRTAMGIGAALIMPSTLSIITDMFPEKERGRAIGVWAGMAGLGIILGPTVGGWLLGQFWWGSVFLINLPIVAVALLAGWALVPESRDPHATPLDPVGALLSIVGLVALVYGIIKAPDYGWTDPVTLGGFAVAAVSLAVFVAWELRSKHPMLNIGFFRNPRFSAASVSVTLVFFALNGGLFILTQHLQFVLGYTPLQAGVRLLPIVTMMVAAPASGIIVDRLGTKAVVTAGLLVDVLGLWIISTVGAGSGYGPVALGLAVIGIGNGLAMAPATASIMGSLPPAKFGVGSAMNDTTRMVGGALGVAVIGSVLNSAYASSIGPALAGLPAAVATAASNSVGAATQVAAHLGAAGGPLVAAAQAAFIDGLGTAVLVSIGFTLAGALVALLFLPARPAQPTTKPQPEAVRTGPAGGTQAAATALVEPAVTVGTDDQTVTP